MSATVKASASDASAAGFTSRRVGVEDVTGQPAHSSDSYKDVHQDPLEAFAVKSALQDVDLRSVRVLLQDWLNQFTTDRPNFQSFALFAEVKTRELMHVTAQLPVPYPVRTAVCMQLLTEIADNHPDPNVSSLLGSLISIAFLSVYHLHDDRLPREHHHHEEQHWGALCVDASDEDTNDEDDDNYYSNVTTAVSFKLQTKRTPRVEKKPGRPDSGTLVAYRMPTQLNTWLQLKPRFVRFAELERHIASLQNQVSASVFPHNVIVRRNAQKWYFKQYIDRWRRTVLRFAFLEMHSHMLARKRARNRVAALTRTLYRLQQRDSQSVLLANFVLWRSQAVASRLSHQQHRLRQLQRIAARHRHECSEAKSRNYDLRKAVASTRLRLTELSAQRDTLLEEIAEVKRRIHTDSSLSRCCVEALKLVDHPLVVLTELIQHEWDITSVPQLLDKFLCQVTDADVFVRARSETAAKKDATDSPGRRKRSPRLRRKRSTAGSGSKRSLRSRTSSPVSVSPSPTRQHRRERSRSFHVEQVAQLLQPNRRARTPTPRGRSTRLLSPRRARSASRRESSLSPASPLSARSTRSARSASAWRKLSIASSVSRRSTAGDVPDSEDIGPSLLSEQAYRSMVVAWVNIRLYTAGFQSDHERVSDPTQMRTFQHRARLLDALSKALWEHKSTLTAVDGFLASPLSVVTAKDSERTAATAVAEATAGTKTPITPLSPLSGSVASGLDLASASSTLQRPRSAGSPRRAKRMPTNSAPSSPARKQGTITLNFARPASSKSGKDIAANDEEEKKEQPAKPRLPTGVRKLVQAVKSRVKGWANLRILRLQQSLSRRYHSSLTEQWERFGQALTNFHATREDDPLPLVEANVACLLHADTIARVPLVQSEQWLARRARAQRLRLGPLAVSPLPGQQANSKTMSPISQHASRVVSCRNSGRHEKRRSVALQHVVLSSLADLIRTIDLVDATEELSAALRIISHRLKLKELPKDEETVQLDEVRRVQQICEVYVSALERYRAEMLAYKEVQMVEWRTQRARRDRLHTALMQRSIYNLRQVALTSKELNRIQLSHYRGKFKIIPDLLYDSFKFESVDVGVLRLMESAVHKHSPALHALFEHYCGLGVSKASVSSHLTMTYGQFWRLARDCHLPSLFKNHTAWLDLVFVRSTVRFNSELPTLSSLSAKPSKKTRARVPAAGCQQWSAAFEEPGQKDGIYTNGLTVAAHRGVLNYHQFLAALVRISVAIAHALYEHSAFQASEVERSIFDSLERIILQKFVPRVNKGYDSDAQYPNELAGVPVEEVLRGHADWLVPLFLEHAGLEHQRLATMNEHEWLRLLQRYELCPQVIPAQQAVVLMQNVCTDAEGRLHKRKRQVGTANLTSLSTAKRNPTLSYREFVEALVGCSFFVVRQPYAPLVERVRIFLDEFKANVDAAKNDTT